MQLRWLGILLAGALTALTGCQQQQQAVPASLDMTFQRGVQLLVAGSPKSAIPFLTQTVVAEPDGPEPLAYLSLAYALDLQGEQAILQAQKVHRPKDAAPGWEVVAVGIAQMTRRDPSAGVQELERAVAAVPPGGPIAPAARQWLALAQLLKGEHDQGVGTLRVLAHTPAMKSTAMLWITLI